MTRPLARLIILSAPSGAGKSTLAKTLVESMDSLEVSVSHTTRSAREGEQDGVDYFFVDRSEFEQMIHAGKFLECAEVFDHLYGTSRDAVNATLASGYSVILDIDWQGARKVRTAMPDALSVFILPPSLDALEKRLVDRGQDSSQAIQRRMQDAVSEISHCLEFDYIIMNEDFERATEELSDLIFKGQAPSSARRFDIDAFVRSAKSGTLKSSMTSTS